MSVEEALLESTRESTSRHCSRRHGSVARRQVRSQQSHREIVPDTEKQCSWDSEENPRYVSSDESYGIPSETFPPLERRLSLPVTVLVLFALACLTCVVFLVVYKVYKYDHSCPEGFAFKDNRCIPVGLETYYPEQDSSARGKFYTVINHYNMAKQTITRSVSPWMTVLSEEKLSEQETEAAQKTA
ncbi:neuronal vesicle trafficking-associated protein 1-like [Microcaecilia unicolor]|uniref:Neuronal vesicle trafficking-associated protein 1 n=1 Tax=Microcaecilia unicolor TaxID=1415580 RepID=A0A6P7WYE5_9AMPH|nr:neuronal vesicle trafficking-associated protein 1-like [Microcaecilia unicolor]